MTTRSMLEIMLELAANVEVPQTDVSQGKATPGRTDSQAGQPAQGPKLRVVSGDARPEDAYVAVQYGRQWFWVPDTDIESKSTFAVVMMMFSATDTGIKGAAPVVTVPAQ